MSWLSILSGFFTGLFGREVWEWMPSAARLLLRIFTRPLPLERRELRRAEWSAELHEFGSRRLSALVWVLSLLPVSLWEAATARGVIRRLGSGAGEVAIRLFFYTLTGWPLIAGGWMIARRLGFSGLVTVAFVLAAPILIWWVGVLVVLAGILFLFYLFWLPYRLWRWMFRQKPDEGLEP